jgi:uncharacterized iron-regulated protein
MKQLSIMLCLIAGQAWAGSHSGAAFDVYVLGEQHDNPAHHATQAERVAALSPSALVFEMIPPEMADAITSEVRENEDALQATLQWEERGWPDFSAYYPIFEAAPEAQIYGAAVPREAARAAMSDIAAAFGPEAARFGLTSALPEDQQVTREEMQLAAHCDALPAEMLPMMVSVQRLRDAALAQAALQALEDTGGPVAVITGNGHARSDWGMPFVLGIAAPEVQVFSLGQGEDETLPLGRFDEVTFAPSVERDDPCAAFRSAKDN